MPEISTCMSQQMWRFFPEDMEKHRAMCPFESVQCVYHSVGFTATMLHKHPEQYHKDKLVQHLKLELTAAKIDLYEDVDKITELNTKIHRTNTALHVYSNNFLCPSMAR